MPTLPEPAKIGVKPNINRTFYRHETASIIRCVSPARPFIQTGKVWSVACTFTFRFAHVEGEIGDLKLVTINLL